MTNDDLTTLALGQHGESLAAEYLEAVGYKFDRWLDVVYMQLMLR